MSNYLYRLARFAFRRRRLVLAAWLLAAIAAIARDHIASRLPATDLRTLTQALRTIASTSPPEASQRRAATP